MARISSYTSDTNVVGNDRWPGSDWQTPDKITKNFTADAVASYFNKSAIIDTGQFSWEFLPYNNTQPQPEKTFMKVDWLDDTININNLAGVLRVSALTLGNTQPGAFIENEWVGNNILIHLPSAPSAYAIYTVDALVPDGDWYYLMTISYVGGQSFVIQKNEPVVMGYFAGANVITEITGTFPIIVSEGSIPDVSIDETKLGEWNLAFNSTITSASVTGTTTKTLTLTEQDGGTITASWTDEDTNLVTSVFGRTGAVVAVSGDYNTSQVTESTNLYFTQARAIASPITGYNPVAGTITASDTILTAINKLSGNISGGYVPYTGATTNVNLGEKGITAGYVGFDLTPTATPTGISTMYWDSAYRTVSLIDGDGDTTLQIGQEERILVHNNTGSTLTDGQVVYVTGSTGNLPSVSLADASSETTSAATLGVVTESIANGADGFITVSGMVNGLNTLAFTEGDLLWLSETAGQFTNIKPIAPAHLVLIGYVIKRAGGNGSILVKIQNTQELSESSDVLISAPEIDGQGLFLQTILGVQLWRNRSIVDVLGYTPADEATTLTINGTTYDLSANRTWSVGTVTSIAVGLGTSGTDVNVSGSPITSSGTITLNIPSASAVNRGLLTPTDWTTFNNKQDAGNYITSLTGEATASGPGAAAVTLSTPAVTGKLLTGVNITGGTVVATDTILEAFGKVQNQINGLVGGSIYKGTWNAATNTPTITSGVGNTGWYYIVSVSGSTNIDGITDWNLGDWIIFDGTAWQQVDNTDAVVSVNGYTGAVSLVSSDVPEGLTNLYFTNARARGAVSLTTTGSSGAATYDSGTGVFNIPNYGSALSGYLTLSGGTLTGGLYINPQNTSTVGLDVASNTVTLRSDNLEGFKRQLTTTMSSGTLIKIQAAGYGGTYVTDLGFYTSSSSAINTIPNLYLTGGDNRVGINTDTPAATLDVAGTAKVSSQLTLGSTITNGTYTYTLPGATGTLALISQIPSVTGFVPYTGATGAVNLGAYDLTVNGITVGIGAGNMSSNTAIGASVLASNTNGSNNAALGYFSLNSNTTGGANTAIGSQTLKSNTNGTFNIAVGYGSLFNSVSANYNTAIGNSALYNTTGSSNTAIGDGAGYNITTGIFNTLIGGYFGTSSMSYNVILSDGARNIRFQFDGTNTLLGQSGNVLINTSTNAGYKLDVNGTGRFTGALSGTSATFSGSVGVGNSLSSWGSIKTLQRGSTSLFEYGINNSVISSNFYYDGGASNYYMNNGYASFYQQYNGGHAFYTSPSGTSGNAITFTKVLDIASTGAATFSSSVTAGGRILTTASGNDTFGFQMYKSGTLTTIAGFYQNTTGDGLIAAYNSAGTQNVQIATNGVSYFNGGNVGIGTTSPNRALHVVGGIELTSDLVSTKGGTTFRLGYDAYTTTSGVNLFTESAVPLVFGTSSTERMRITSAGSVLVGTTSATGLNTAIAVGSSSNAGFILQISGTNRGYFYASGNAVFLESTNSATIYVAPNGANGVYIAPGSTSWTSNSDIRLKNVNSEITNALEKINTLKAINYSWKSDTTNKENIGLIAQEVNEVLPQIIDTNKDGYLGVRYTELVPVLVQAIKELKAELDTLKNK